MKITTIVVLFFALCFVTKKSAGQKLVKEPQAILKSFNSFWQYWSDEVRLSRDYNALDENGVAISRENFLQQLISGNYLPLKLKGTPEQVFKLYKLSDNKEENIRSVIIAQSRNYYKFFQMEGKPLPAFDFIDLNGEHYNPENTKGKILVLKCWFINCVACVKEFPELNKIVASYRNKEDVLFVSLASDPADNLKEFLKKRKFNYQVIPLMGDYMSDKLKITGYPTHIIVNKAGLISKVMEDAADLKNVLSKEVNRTY